MAECMCGCGAQVAKRFKQGHDARLKASLVRSAMLGDDPDAERMLAELGWTKFLDKARQSKHRRSLPGHQQRALTEAQAQARAIEKLRVLEGMKEAWAALKLVDRSPEIQVTRANWEYILDDPLDYEPGDERR